MMARATDPSGGGEHVHANATYWFERELRQYPTVDLDLDALQVHANRIVLVAGREARGYPTYVVNLELGRKLAGTWSSCPAGTPVT